jgi:hypothetical protein
MLKLISVAAALAAALSLATGPALAAQDKHAPSAQDKHESDSAGQGKPSFEHVHALAVTADGRMLFLGAHSGLFRSEDAGRSWQPVALPSKHPHMDVMAVTPHPGDARTIYVATHGASIAIAQPADEALRKEIDALKQEQAAICTEIAEIKDLLRPLAASPQTNALPSDILVAIQEAPILGHASADGEKARVRATPAFLIGLTEPDGGPIRPQRLVAGAQPFAAFKEAIDGVLAKKP